MNIRHLTDDARLRLATVAPVALMAVAGVTAIVLGALGSTTGARAALAIAVASSFPVLVATLATRSVRWRRLGPS